MYILYSSSLFILFGDLKVKDDRIIIDKTVGDQVSLWKSSKGLTDNVLTDHACSGDLCTYHQVGNLFVCEKTGYVHGRKRWQQFHVIAFKYLL